MLHSYRYLLFVLLLLSLISCRKTKVKRAYYYWKTSYALNASEKDYLKQTKCEKLFLRFFDVIVGPTGEAKPESPIVFHDSLPLHTEMVPVVFIRNEVFQNIKEKDIDTLAFRIMTLVQQIAKSRNIYFYELQIDCDWSGSTQRRYFDFLKSLKQQSQVPLLSATIRLHQVKYKEKTGVPPVDKGMLMYYNMGTIALNERANSIFDDGIAQQYSGYISKYSLPLDIALPIFHWAVHGDASGKVKGLIEHISMTELEDTSHFRVIENKKYEVTNAFILHGTYLQKKDVLKFEDIDYNTLYSAASQVAAEFKTPPAVVGLFAIDSANFSHFKPKEIEKIYHTF